MMSTLCLRQLRVGQQMLSVLSKQVRAARTGVKQQASAHSLLYSMAKPAAFTLAFGASSFAIAAIVDHEILKLKRGPQQRPFSLWNAIRQRPLTTTRVVQLLKAKWNSWNDSEKLAASKRHLVSCVYNLTPSVKLSA